MPRAIVYVQRRKAGILKENEDSFEFFYLPEYLESDRPLAVSLTLPLQIEPFVSGYLFPFFDGLLPEGWQHELAVENWDLDPCDRFGLLLKTTWDPIGDVAVIADDPRQKVRMEKRLS